MTLLTALQATHDSYPPEKWEDRLEQVKQQWFGGYGDRGWALGRVEEAHK